MHFIQYHIFFIVIWNSFVACAQIVVRITIYLNKIVQTEQNIVVFLTLIHAFYSDKHLTAAAHFRFECKT